MHNLHLQIHKEETEIFSEEFNGLPQYLSVSPGDWNSVHCVLKRKIIWIYGTNGRSTNSKLIMPKVWKYHWKGFIWIVMPIDFSADAKGTWGYSKKFSMGKFCPWSNPLTKGPVSYSFYWQNGTPFTQLVLQLCIPFHCYKCTDFFTAIKCILPLLSLFTFSYNTSTSETPTLSYTCSLPTLGARDFSSAVSGFCQVLIVTRRFPAGGFGPQPQKCRPSAHTENSRRTREKPLVSTKKIKS